MPMAIKRYLLTYFFAYLLNVLACLVATVSWQLSISVPEFRENVSILSLTGGKGIYSVNVFYLKFPWDHFGETVDLIRKSKPAAI